MDIQQFGLQHIKISASGDVQLYIPATSILSTRLAASIQEHGSLDDAMYSGTTFLGRALICRCGDGKYYSVCIRPENLPSKTNTNSPWKVITGKPPKLDRSAYAPMPGHFSSNGKLSDFLFDLQDQCTVIFDLLNSVYDENLVEKSGLIIVVGRTGCGKSQITRGLIHLLLANKIASMQNIIPAKSGVSQYARPHLLTIENPIEKYLFLGKNKPIRSECIQRFCGVDYTPRVVGAGKDVPNLRRALMNDALRQKPTIVYVGELREEAELVAALDFAETGHLMVTTMHAGSVREAMQRIFNAKNAETPSDQGQIAQKIRAIIHLDFLDDWKAHNRTFHVVVPAVWAGTSTACTGIVADGLSSILPHSTTETRYSFGRKLILQNLWDQRKSVLAREFNQLIRTGALANWTANFAPIMRGLNVSLHYRHAPTELIKSAIQSDLRSSN